MIFEIYGFKLLEHKLTFIEDSDGSITKLVLEKPNNNVPDFKKIRK